jgi:hypothetical protein
MSALLATVCRCPTERHQLAGKKSISLMVSESGWRLYHTGPVKSWATNPAELPR